MNALSETVCRMTGAKSVELGEIIQSLWSGYGVIQRAQLVGVDQLTDVGQARVVIKHIDISRVRPNGRGWGGDISHQRKVRSYQIENAFYEGFARQCTTGCQVPNLVACEQNGDDGWVIVLEDLDYLGFDRRKSTVAQQDVHACLSWLANFHATFIGTSAAGLWPIGTYWHLDTRPDEFAAMPAGPLKQSAALIDRRLNEAEYQTLVHGDAKVANFCFSGRETSSVAAVDFQYVGRGCGMKDVAYFISSCLSEQKAAAQQETLLNFYFQQLKTAILSRHPEVNFSALEIEWRELYPFAWADFCRFLSGWSPEHWKLNAYTEQITQSVLKQLSSPT